ncbi:MAG: Periplasmic thiol:disulfide interchange protein DsbA [Parcubacteria group bacterium GW2011_GWB1_43_8]|nr:MAG: Periplasmic thiol:disulfide interchange protein DsbA [Parcubacteria group bacterium GW2011_GWB1_43_8]
MRSLRSVHIFLFVFFNEVDIIVGMENQNLNMQTEIAPKNNFAVPMAIIIAGVLVAGALYFNKGNRGSGDPNNLAVEDNNAAETAQENKVKPVSSADHIRGNPNAKVKVIEFSDPECPFCKRFHYTMNQIIDEYGKSGQVAWVYRHFPLDAIHSKARKESEALECANEQGGSAKFWAYLDRLFEVTPSNDGLDLAELPKIAEYVGLDKVQFNQCLESGKYAKRVADDLADGVKSGARGTPYSVVVAANGKKFVINGALPYESVKATINQALAEK